MSPNQLILQSLKLKSKQFWGQCVHSWEVERKCTLHPVSSLSSLWLPACGKKLVLTTFPVSHSQWTFGSRVDSGHLWLFTQSNEEKSSSVSTIFIFYRLFVKQSEHSIKYSNYHEIASNRSLLTMVGTLGSAPPPSESLTFMGYRGFTGSELPLP